MERAEKRKEKIEKRNGKGEAIKDRQAKHELGAHGGKHESAESKR
jgi:general stress protein YciG